MAGPGRSVSRSHAFTLHSTLRVFELNTPVPFIPATLTCEKTAEQHNTLHAEGAFGNPAD